jgi:hypothetical protein
MKTSHALSAIRPTIFVCGVNMNDCTDVGPISTTCSKIGGDIEFGNSEIWSLDIAPSSLPNPRFRRHFLRLCKLGLVPVLELVALVSVPGVQLLALLLLPRLQACGLAGVLRMMIGLDLMIMPELFAFAAMR